MPRAALIWPITSKAAKTILCERRITMDRFLQTGELILDINSKLIKIGRSRWQVVDFYDALGGNLKAHLSPEEQQLLPAVEAEMEVGTFAENSQDREEAARRHRNLQALRAG